MIFLVFFLLCESIIGQYSEESNTSDNYALNLKVYSSGNSIGDGCYLLGITIRDGEKGEVLLDNERFINKVLIELKIDSCKIRKIPLDPGAVAGLTAPPANEDVLKAEEMKTYQGLVDLLLYISMVSPPDITHAAIFLGWFNAKLTKIYLVVTKHAFRYLKLMKHLALHFPTPAGIGDNKESM